MTRRSVATRCCLLLRITFVAFVLIEPPTFDAGSSNECFGNAAIPTEYGPGVVKEGYWRRYFRIGQNQTLVWWDVHFARTDQIDNITIKDNWDNPPEFKAVEITYRFFILPNSTSSLYLECRVAYGNWSISPVDPQIIQPGIAHDTHLVVHRPTGVWHNSLSEFVGGLTNSTGMLWGWWGWPHENPDSNWWQRILRLSPWIEIMALPPLAVSGFFLFRFLREKQRLRNSAYRAYKEELQLQEAEEKHRQMRSR